MSAGREAKNSVFKWVTELILEHGHRGGMSGSQGKLIFGHPSNTRARAESLASSCARCGAAKLSDA